MQTSHVWITACQQQYLRIIFTILMCYLLSTYNFPSENSISWLEALSMTHHFHF